MNLCTHSVVLAAFDQRSSERVEAYLYAHSRIVATIEVPERRLVAFILRTEGGFAGEPERNEERLQHLAQYQCDRLRSGLFGAEVVGEYPAAIVRACEALGIEAKRPYVDSNEGASG